MPREQSIRRDDGPNLPERTPAERLRCRRQADPLIVLEPYPLGAELFSQHAVLALKIGDHVALLLMDPAGNARSRNRKGWDAGGMARQAISYAGAMHPG
jgi:hypothetical protein